MPELPEVETIVRASRPRLEGRRIVSFETLWPRNTHPSAAEVQEAIQGRRIAAVSRRAKYIVIELSGCGFLLIHLRMSGRFEWGTSGEPGPAHVRARWLLDDGQRLLFCDARKFGRIVFTRDLAAATAGLGVEPLEPAFTVRRLGELLQRRARQIKPLLLDQSVIAGLGNIYTDEALFEAGLHPLTPSNRLTAEQVRRLHRAIRAVLQRGIRRQGASIDWVYPGGSMQDHFRVYGRGGEPCRQCRNPIESIRVGQRGTHFCRQCQPPPRRRVRAARAASVF